MSPTVTQIKKIHALSRNAGLDEDTRRDLMEREVGVRSTKDMTAAQAIRVIDRLKVIAGDRAKPATRKPAASGKGALALEGPFVAVIRALWISGHALGVIENPSDTAMVAFVERQTGIQNMAWVRDPRDGRKAIEGMKAWLARAGGVVWRREDETGHGRKLAVYLALRRLLTAAGVDPQFIDFPGRIGVRSLDEARLDALIRDGGERLAQARREA
ncbi:regulatory protein GemA [Methylopila sp. 73B]|uniref:regulatory protein GemA n=1 Tax=Methylopila sp. 73B TaxID=1120792 RepID=UPI000376CAFF|nr:regulatory protein GemA [Methylopila sp. 73B]